MPGPASSRAALDALDGAFRRAWEDHPARRHRADLILGGFTVRLSMVGDALWERLGPALSHLEGPGAEGVPDLEVTLWDEGATGVPGPFVSLADVLPSGRPFGFGLLGEDRSEAVAGYQTEASCTLLDRRAGRIAGWIRDPEELSDYETGKPLQPLLFAWAQDRDLLPVHAALVALGGRGVLLGGHGGSGKSTSALSCLWAGFDYLGDDYIGVAAPEGSRFLGHSFYSTSWLEPAHAARFPWLGAAFEDAEPPRGDKRLIRLGTLFPERMASSAPIAVLALPRVGGGGPTRARRIRPAEAVRRLAPSSILQLPFSDPGRLLDRMAGLAHAVPCYRLELGDPAGIPSCLERLLDEVEAW